MKLMLVFLVFIGCSVAPSMEQHLPPSVENVVTNESVPMTPLDPSIPVVETIEVEYVKIVKELTGFASYYYYTDSLVIGDYGMILKGYEDDKIYYHSIGGPPSYGYRNFYTYDTIYMTEGIYFELEYGITNITK